MFRCTLGAYGAYKIWRDVTSKFLGEQQEELSFRVARPGMRAISYPTSDHHKAIELIKAIKAFIPMLAL
jgi:hypothetical protein